MKLPGININKDWVLMGGTAILAITGLIYLHNRFSGYVPTVPGVRYGPGNPATGIYTGQGPYKPFPVAQDIYGPVAGAVGPYEQEGQSLVRQGVGDVQSMFASSGDIGRGNYRDRWVDVYDPKKGPTSKITHDDPDKRVSLA